jgi:hypothetical protein
VRANYRQSFEKKKYNLNKTSGALMDLDKRSKLAPAARGLASQQVSANCAGISKSAGCTRCAMDGSHERTTMSNNALG